MSATQIKKVNWWHKSIFDWEIANPSLKMKDCAVAFGVSETWLSIIRNSDIYMEYAALRREEHNDNVSKTVIERVEDVADVSLEVLEERIRAERKTLGLGIVNNAAEMALKALGFGQKSSSRGDTQINVILGAADPALLERARETMRTVNAHKEPDLAGAHPPILADEVANAEQPPKTLSAPSQVSSRGGD